MQTRRTQSIRLMTVALMLLLALVLPGHRASAAMTATQQAKANAALLGLWNDKQDNWGYYRGPKVTVGQIKAMLDRGADVNARHSNGATPLTQAAAYWERRVRQVASVDGSGRKRV